MFRAPADLIGEALQPPPRVRFVLFLLGIYAPVAAIVGLLQIFISNIKTVHSDTGSTGVTDSSPAPAQRSSVRRWAYRIAAGAALSAVVVSGARFLEPTPDEEKAAEYAREGLLPPFGAVLSPSGTVLGSASISHHVDHDDLHLAVVAVDDTNRASVDARRLLPRGVKGGNGVVLNWADELHLVVAGMVGSQPPSGPESIGGVQISYKPYVFGQVEGYDPQTRPIPVSDVTYSVEQATMQAVKLDTPMCAIHVRGMDDRLHRRIGFNLIGIGVEWEKSESAVVPYALMFDATDSPGATNPMTLTQAVLRDVGGATLIDRSGSPDRIIVNPAQAHVLTPASPAQASAGRSSQPFMQNVIYSAPISRDRVTTVFDRFREGRYQAVFEFGLGREVVTYAFDTPIPRSIAEQFQRCEAAANMTAPLIGPHLTSDQLPDRHCTACRHERRAAIQGNTHEFSCIRIANNKSTLIDPNTVITA